ncbi:MAG: hypothetical protein ACTHLO_18945 [Pseudolabrys sp.]
MGNRGGRFHTDEKTLTTRRWTSRQWICCVLDFKNRQRNVWGRYYTELFFLDEVTAFAAGHRPCFECRRRDAEHFAKLFHDASTHSVRPRESGGPEQQAHEREALGSRFRGNERRVVQRMTADAMDEVLHRERLDGRAKRTHRAAIDALPDGATIALEGEAFALRGDRMLHWTPAGYDAVRPRLRGTEVEVLTPPSIVAVLSRGYRPQWHPSAGTVT